MTNAVDLLVKGARLVEPLAGPAIPGGWVAARGGFVVALGRSGDEPAAREVLDARDCLVTPGLVNTHHHIFQNLTRAFAPVVSAPFADWIEALGPIWARMDEEAAYVSTWIGLAELALGGCTTTSDQHYVHPIPKLIDAQIRAAHEVGLRFHPARGSFDRTGDEAGGMPPALAEDCDTILSDCERLVSTFHDRAAGAMVQIALGPGSPYHCSRELMRESRDLAERLDIRLHTHLAQVADEESYCRSLFGCRPVELLDDLGWADPRTWVAHCIYPSAEDIETLGRTRTGVAHCPSSNMMICEGIAPVVELRQAGVPVGLGCDGSASTDHACMWLEARTALLLGRLRRGPGSMSAHDVLEIATRGGAACLGRKDIGTLAPGMAADLVAWPLTGVAFAGAWTDPVEALLRCGPVLPRHTVVAGRAVVRDGELQPSGVEEMLARHAGIARDWQRTVLPNG
ncbi:MAG: amidohydrolase family protein [Gaiellales bacterium]